ncbi:MAG: hypothetical protein GQ550_02390 [Gammaproteobacteria bacterium]|nr:hypothetical protein [Gammaproteobacteria bacterium]
MTKYQRPFLYLLLSLTLLACTQPAEDPKTVADKYWQYMQTGNLSEAEKLVSTNSHDALQEQHRRMNSIAQLNNGEAMTIINTTITTINPDSNYRHTESFNTVLVLQQGKWKVDLNQSQIPPALSANEEKLQQLSEELSESMQENIESIDDAMNEGMQMLNEALHDGSKEMGDSLLHLMNELNKSMQESIDKMKQRREQQMQEQKKQSLQPDPRQGEGMI